MKRRDAQRLSGPQIHGSGGAGDPEATPVVMRSNMYRAFVTGFLVLGLALLGAGCGGEAIVGERVPNAAPDTQVESTPPNLDETTFSIEFFWSGSDPDGEVVAFEWIITDNGPNNVIAPADTAVEWNRTVVTDSTFIVSADIPEFPPDLGNPELDEVSEIRFWQTHTFFVRSVDDGGRRDPTPAKVSFTATTLAPSITVTEPTVLRNVNTCTFAPLAPSFRWEGVDPDNPEGDDVAEVRYALIQLENCYTDLTYREDNPVARLTDEDWSEWIPFDAGADSGKFKRFPILDAPVQTPFLFVVQARDVAGAVTPTFDWNINVRHFRTSTSNFPLFNVNETNLGSESKSGLNNIIRRDLVAGQPLNFSWSANAQSYGGIVEEFRYGFNVLDPNNEDDPGWSVPWGPAWRTASRETGFAEGTPNFVVQVRDNSGSISRFVYQFQVIQVKPRRDQRPLLLVDDVDYGGDLILQELFQSQWRDLLTGVQNFSPTFDLIYAQGTEAADLQFAKVNDYRAVIWLLTGNSNSFVARNLGPQGRTTTRFNWLEVYQREAGNVFMAGRQAMTVWTKDVPTVMTFPLILNTSQRPPNGLGTQDVAGRTVNVGTLRYPYTGWCLDSIDQVNPNESITGESNREKRNTACDSYVYAMVSPGFVSEFLPTPQQVPNLYPKQIRTTQVGGAPRELSTIGLPYEEFYNINAGSAPVTLRLQDCQIPMFTAVARMDVDNPAIMQPDGVDPVYHIDPIAPLVNKATCPAVRVESRQTSRVSRAPIAVASTQYINTKQNNGLPQEDYLWGFNPLGFQLSQVRSTMEWILLRQWGLNED